MSTHIQTSEMMVGVFPPSESVLEYFPTSAGWSLLARLGGLPEARSFSQLSCEREASARFPEMWGQWPHPKVSHCCSLSLVPPQQGLRCRVGEVGFLRVGRLLSPDFGCWEGAGLASLRKNVCCNPVQVSRSPVTLPNSFHPSPSPLSLHQKLG